LENNEKACHISPTIYNKNISTTFSAALQCRYNYCNVLNEHPVRMCARHKLYNGNAIKIVITILTAGSRTWSYSGTCEVLILRIRHFFDKSKWRSAFFINYLIMRKSHDTLNNTHKINAIIN